MLWKLDHVLCQLDRVINPPNKDQVANQPFVVVSEIANLIRHDTITHHVGVVDAGGSLLLVDRILVPFQSRINMSGHVPHVSNARCRNSASRGGFDRVGWMPTVPKMNGVVMGRMKRFDLKNVINQ